MENESLQQFEKRMSTVTVPAGFTAAYEDDVWGFGEKKETWRKFILTKPDDTVIEFHQTGSGHTSFKTEKGWMSFDRRGVVDSFYHVSLFKSDEVKDLNVIVAEQLERIEKRRAYYKSAVSVPGMNGYSVAPDGVASLKSQIKKNGYVTFTPSGFGTGYTVQKKQPDRMTLRFGGKRAPAELEAFLGTSPLWVVPFDHD